MLLRSLLALSLLPFLATEGGGAGAGTTAGTTGTSDEGGTQGRTGASGDATTGTTSGTQGQQDGTDGATETGETSANKLMKDFAAKRGVTVADLLTKYQEYEDERKTDQEKLLTRAETAEAELAKLQTEVRETRAESAFLDAAREAKARAPKTLFRAYKSELAFDDDGKVSNLAAVIEKARKDEPELFRAADGAGDGGKNTPSTDGTFNMNQAIADRLGR